MSDPTQKLLKELIDYSPDCGNVYWKYRAEKFFSSGRSYRSWNTKHAGKLTNSLNGSGYLQIAIMGKRYPLHRIAYIWMYGCIEGRPIDHINGQKLDNRIENLRACTPSENARNIKLPKDNKSGRIGVHKHSACDMWVAQIRMFGKTHHLGIYKNIDDAKYARRIAEAKFNFHPNHGRVV